MLSERSYPAKVILLGEYSVLLDDRAIAMPFRQFSARWSQDTDSQRVFGSLLRSRLTDLLATGILDERIYTDIQSGWHVDSSIPVGQGMGSSGALCAALYDVYAEEADDLQIIRKELQILESVYHGTSSGVDPLVSYTDALLQFLPDGQVYSGQLDQLHDIYLWPSHIERSSADLVGAFARKCSDPSWRQLYDHDYLPCLRALEESILSGTSSADDWALFSQWQLQLFPEMIPEHVQAIWKAGLRSGRYRMKLCGAGGGGYFLVHSSLPDALTELIPLS